MEPVALSKDERPYSPIQRLIRQHPTAMYFVLAFAGSWLFWIPIALSQSANGLGILPFTFPDITLILLLMFGGWAGPMGSALAVTAVTAGRTGVGRLLLRVVYWRVGFLWYLVILVGFPLATLTGYSVVTGLNLFGALAEQPANIATAFLAQLAFSFPTANVQEEIGWRGFALPRLQRRFGPIAATLILGTLHSLWHVPLFFTPLLGPTTPTNYAGFVVVGIAISFVYTWIFNHTQGSVLIAALVHGCTNAAVGLAGALIPASLVVTGWAAGWASGDWQGLNILVLGYWALVVILASRGRLGYRADENDRLGSA